MKYRKLVLAVSRGVVLLLVSAVITETTMSYLVQEYGVQISATLHNVIILVAIWGPFYLTLPRVVAELEALKKPPE